MPLDRAQPELGEIDIGFEFVPATDRRRPARGTVVGLTGGPGGANPVDP